MAAKTPVVPENLKQFFPDRFQIVKTTVDRKELLRDPAGLLVHSSGYGRFNTVASEGARLQAGKLFDDLTKCGILWAADEATGEVAGCFVPPTVAGVTGIRQYKGGLIGATLRGLYKERPALRPETRKWVSVTFHEEEGKYPYFVLHLNIALPQAKRRKSSPEAKAAKEKEKAEKEKAAREKAAREKAAKEKAEQEKDAAASIETE